MNTLLKLALRSYARHLEAAHQQPLAVIIDRLLAEEADDKYRVAARLGVTSFILDDLLGLCDTRPLDAEAAPNV